MRHSKPRYRLSEAFQLLGLPRASGYQRIKEGSLRRQKDGRRSYVSAAEIERYVRARDAEMPAPATTGRPRHRGRTQAAAEA